MVVAQVLVIGPHRFLVDRVRRVDGEVYVVDYAGRVLLFDPPPPVRARLPLVVR